jgi:diaminopimelate epimerase
LKFVKMSGAGNDFIMVDRTGGESVPVLTGPAIRRLCTRGLSVGADGVIEIFPDSGASFRMRYTNSDGGFAAMCGNGGRCAAVFSVSLGLAPASGLFTFRSDAGLHRAEVTGPGSARIWMTDPVLHFLAEEITLPDAARCIVSLADTGVPHAVLFPPDSVEGDFLREAPAFRSHPRFGPGGANVDFAVPIGRSGISLRTWERGVEGETLACGTGAVAAVFCGTRLGLLDLPVEVRVRSGLVLRVGSDPTGWWLEGEARAVYNAELLSWSVGLTEDI